MYFSTRTLVLFAAGLCLTPITAGQDASWDVSSSSLACGKVLNTTDLTVDALHAYNCLISTPFDKDIASALLQYWRDTLEFQSTVEYLKNPPQSYQQPNVDLRAGFDLIQAQIDTGVFTNQYTFEAAVQALLYSAHDTHLALSGGILGVFEFGSPHQLVAVSDDGFVVPKIYFAVDFFEAEASGWDFYPSAVTTINSVAAESFISTFASRNVLGSVEPHGDWNQMFFSSAGYIQGFQNNLRSTIFYPGDTLEFQFENGTTVSTKWQAVKAKTFNGPLINDGEDFYDWFVLGLDTPSDIAASGSAPAKRSPQLQITSTTTALVSGPTNDPDANLDDGLEGWGHAYPEVADLRQARLGFGGIITGYYFTDIQLGVLSIPSFDANGPDIQEFSNTVAQFLGNCTSLGMQKILIDLQQNTGGLQLLATDTFKQFFPNIEPFSGMRSRSSHLADALGNTLTNYFIDSKQTLNDVDTQKFINSPWEVADEIDVQTGKGFSSWAEYNGPNFDHDDFFSAISQFDLSNQDFTNAAIGIPIHGYGDLASQSDPPFSADNIVILTDGVCASTCDLFVEMMHHEAGVRTVAVGGLPQFGPMQARGGTRGALSYTSNQLDGDFAAAVLYNNTDAGKSAFPNRPEIYSQVTQLSFNLRDQVRKGENFPLQFAYEAADCRIYYTPDTIHNYPFLWVYTHDAIFFNGSTCVSLSDQHRDTMRTDQTGPGQQDKDLWASSNAALVRDPDSSAEDQEDDRDSLLRLASKKKGFNKADKLEQAFPNNKLCKDGTCPAKMSCVNIQTCSQRTVTNHTVCVQFCNTIKDCTAPASFSSTNTSSFKCEKQHCVPTNTSMEYKCFESLSNDAKPVKIKNLGSACTKDKNGKCVTSTKTKAKTKTGTKTTTHKSHRT